MKRLLFSVLCSGGLIFSYFLLLAVLYQIFQLSFQTLATLLIPLNFPYEIYKNLFGMYYGNRNNVKILNYAALILIYAIPFYLIFALYARIKNKSQKQTADSPPKPPAFS